MHLPLDLRLAAPDGEQHASIDKARRVIELTRPLQPWAYVLHLDGRELIGGSSPAEKEGWNDQAVQALELLAGWAGDPRLLAVENLERYALDFIDEAVRRAGPAAASTSGTCGWTGTTRCPTWKSTWNGRACCTSTASGRATTSR